MIKTNYMPLNNHTFSKKKPHIHTQYELKIAGPLEWMLEIH